MLGYLHFHDIGRPFRFKTFPKINLPVPSVAKTSGGSTPTVSFPTVNPSFGVPTGTSQQQKQPSFGSSGQGKFGFGSSAITPFGSFSPSFGRPELSPPASAPATSTSTAVPPGNDGEASSVVAAVGAGVEANIGGASGGGGGGADVVPAVVVDSAAVASATAGVPGPGVLMLDVEARRAARCEVKGCMCWCFGKRLKILITCSAVIM